MAYTSDENDADSTVFLAPIDEDDPAMCAVGGSSGWQLLSVSLHRSASVGFGIAISGGVDNPLFTSGERAIVISDIVPHGPASSLLQLNDRILSANSISFENIEYERAVDVIKNSQHINMIVKRRVAMPVLEFEQRTLKFTLTKSRKKDDFGIQLGCKFYIKEIRNPKLAEKEPGLREGDAVLRINGQSLDGITLEEASKWLERSREKLCLVIQRDVRRGSSRWPSTQTVYERVGGGSMAPTPRHSPSPLLHQPLSARSSHEYMNNPSWRVCMGEKSECYPPSGGAPSTASANHSQCEWMEPSTHEYSYYPQQPMEDKSVRSVSFHKELGGSVGIRVVGGNQVGIFVSAVAADSPAALHGVCAGDRILEVNGRNVRGMTREEAVQLLLSLEGRVLLHLQHAAHQFEEIRQQQIGDNFFVRSHFTKEKKASALELAIHEGDIFHVTDTLFGGTVGLWQACRVYSASGKMDGGKGVIPNSASASNFARQARANAEQKSSRGTLLRRKLESRRTKSLPKNMLVDDAGEGLMPAYERVSLNTPTFHRPVVLYGALADVARRLLVSQFALRFSSPASEGVVRLAAVDAVMSSGKHAVLDITLDSVERLQLAQYAPIVILIHVEGRSRIREIRRRLNAPQMSSRKLSEESAMLKKHHSHLLSATVDATHEEGWFDALRELIAHLQLRRLWMPELPPALPLEDILLFNTSTTEGKGSDSEKSVHADYAHYSTHSSNTDLNRSLYEQHSHSPSSFMSAGRPSHAQPWCTLPRKTQQVERPERDVHTLSQLEQQQLHPHPLHSSTSHLLQHRLDGDTRRGTKKMDGEGGMGGRSGKVFDVHDVLRDDEESRLVSELSSASMHEDAPSNGGSHKDYDFPPTHSAHSALAHSGAPSDRSGGRSEVTSSPSGSSSVAGGGERPPLAPKPTSLYTQAHMRNEWRERGASGVQGGGEGRRVTGEGDDEALVVEEASALIGSEGGIVSCVASSVQLIVPPGAIPHSEQHLIYVKVCEETAKEREGKGGKGEQLLSPLVMCGPHGLEFSVPVELRLPHNGKEGWSDEWKFSLKTGDGEEWKQVDVSADSKKPFISLPITKF